MDLNIDTGGKIELLELVHGARGWVDNVEKTLVGPNLELVGRLLVHVNRAVDGELLNPGGQRDGASDFGTSALGSFNDLDSGAVDGPVVKGAKANADFLIHDGKVVCVGEKRVLIPATALGDELINNIARNFLKTARLHGVGGPTG